MIFCAVLATVGLLFLVALILVLMQVLSVWQLPLFLAPLGRADLVAIIFDELRAAHIPHLVLEVQQIGRFRVAGATLLATAHDYDAVALGIVWVTNAKAGRLFVDV